MVGAQDAEHFPARRPERVVVAAAVREPDGFHAGVELFLVMAAWRAACFVRCRFSRMLKIFPERSQT